MNVLQSLLFDEVCGRRSLRGRDVAELARLYASNETVCQTEIAALLTINRACFVQDPSWSRFLVDVLADFVVKDLEPAGYITADNAAWLISAIAPDGRPTSSSLLDVVPEAIARARFAPPSLVQFLLRAVLRIMETCPASLNSAPAEQTHNLAPHDVSLVMRTMDAARAASPTIIGFGEMQPLAAIATMVDLERGADLRLRVQALIVEAALYASGFGRQQSVAERCVGAVNGHADVALEPLVHAAAETHELDRLERQRFAIVVGEAHHPLSAEGLAKILAGSDRAFLQPLARLHNGEFAVLAAPLERIVSRHAVAA